MTRITTISLDGSVFRDFAPPRPLRLVAVQLDSPFDSIPASSLIREDRSGERLQWDSRDKEAARTDRVFEILDAVVDGGDVRSLPDIVLFPEYSVPETAHSDGRFQAFADRHQTIVVPGSFYCSGNRALERLNVCRVYIPGRPRPAVVVKRHPSPLEAKYLSDPGKRGNVLQMLLSLEGTRTVSLNVFICRDYLLPYDDNGFREAAKLWAYEGINFVLMHNEEARLFEGQAAPEVRRLRGPGRVVVFVNNADTCCDLGTAILGPAPGRERDDVVKSVPWDREGMLIATVRPWDVRHQETRPDHTRDYPISHTSVSLFDPPQDGALMLQPSEQQPAYRAVWKPAFLEAIHRVIVMDFRVAKKLSQTIKTLEEKNARFHAVAIRGVQDIVIRRYAYRYERKNSGDIPPLASFFTGLAHNDLAELFQERDVLRIIVYPKDILKYRGVDVREDLFTAHAKEIARDLSKLQVRGAGLYLDRLDEVGSLATEANPDEGLPDAIKPYFFEEFEQHISVGEYSSSVQETYILIGLQVHDERLRREFFHEMIVGSLMNEDVVREIFAIRTMEGDLHFEYFVKLKARAYETNRIIRNLRTWHDSEDAVVLTRTFDVTDYLKNNSVLGVANFDQGLKISEFVEVLGENDLRNIHSRIDLADAAHRRQLVFIASEWSRAKAAAEGTEETIHSDTIDVIYTNIALLTFAHGEDKDEYLDRVQAALLTMYQSVEDRATEILAETVGAQDSMAGGELGLLVEKQHPAVLRDGHWAEIRSHPEKVLLVHAGVVASKAILDEGARSLVAQARRTLNRLWKLRNSLAHTRRSDMVRPLSIASSDGWEERLREVGSYARDTLRLLEALEHLRPRGGL
ncbi:MAG TPA: hypothetical protein VEX35_10330 [Allosphingosinicella sp.]|nr:hypothetical protein [Allosphingosinicella sp.]